MPKYTLRLDAIRPETAQLFDVLAQFPQPAGLTLIGGTAIALLIAHRRSNDLDFAVFGDQLPLAQIDSLITELKAVGMPVQLITDPTQIANFKTATGKRLLNCVRDYMFGDTEVTFFAMGAKQPPGFLVYLQRAERLQPPEVSFGILGLEGLKVSKAVVIGQRVRSRDLFDLYVLVQDHGYSVAQLLEDAKTYGTVDDPEYQKAVLRGEVPLDADGEGLEPVGVQPSMGFSMIGFPSLRLRRPVALLNQVKGVEIFK